MHVKDTTRCPYEESEVAMISTIDLDMVPARSNRMSGDKRQTWQCEGGDAKM